MYSPGVYIRNLSPEEEECRRTKIAFTKVETNESSSACNSSQTYKAHQLFENLCSMLTSPDMKGKWWFSWVSVEAKITALRCRLFLKLKPPQTIKKKYTKKRSPLYLVMTTPQNLEAAQVHRTCKSARHSCRTEDLHLPNLPKPRRNALWLCARRLRRPGAAGAQPRTGSRGPRSARRHPPRDPAPPDAASRGFAAPDWILPAAPRPAQPGRAPTGEGVEGGGLVLVGIPVGGVADHQAGLAHGTIAHQHALDPQLRTAAPGRAVSP